jgi:hypothetical protein
MDVNLIKTIVLELAKTWYWIVIPVILLRFLVVAWLWWRQEVWEKRQKYTFLEIVPPREINEPFRAMEQVFSNIWGIYSSLNGFKNWSRKWIEGRKLYHFCLEIISIGNQPRIFIRCLDKHHDTIKTAIRAQFPQTTIFEDAEDYTKSIIPNIPNKDWTLYGFDLALIKSDVYPIKTYPQFFETRTPDITTEAERIDPLNTLLESMSQLESDECLWIQIKATPITNKDNHYVSRRDSLVARLAHRKKTIKKNPTEKEGGFVPPEMKLTPHEKEIVDGVENKISKQGFETSIRCLYLNKKSVAQRERRGLGEQFFSGFTWQDLNGFKKLNRTKTRTYFYHIFIKRFDFLKKRQIFRRYLLREWPLYPSKKYLFTLNTEELATIFHLPFQLDKLGIKLFHR